MADIKEYNLVKDAKFAGPPPSLRTLRVDFSIEDTHYYLEKHNIQWTLTDNMRWMSDAKIKFDKAINASIDVLNVEIPMTLIMETSDLVNKDAGKAIQTAFTFHVKVSLYHDHAEIALHRIEEQHQTFYPPKTDPFQTAYKEIQELQPEMIRLIENQFNDKFNVVLKNRF